MSSKFLTAYSVKIITWGAKNPETNLPKLEILFNLYIKYIKTITKTADPWLTSVDRPYRTPEKKISFLFELFFIIK